jgi:hypothetical protein
LRERADRVRDTGPRGDRRDAERASEPRPSLRGEDRVLFVTHVDDADVVLLTAVEDREDVSTAEREEMRDA